MPAWTNRYNGVGNSYDTASSVTTDTNGNVFVTGYASGTGGTDICLTIKYSNAGVPLWTNTFSGPAFNADVATDIVMDRNGSVFVTGTSYGNGTSAYLTIRYSAIGPIAIEKSGARPC